MSNAVRVYTEISRVSGIVTVAESGVYAQGSSPAGESFIDIEVLQSISMVDEAGATVILNFKPSSVAVTNSVTKNTAESTLDSLATARQKLS